ncbi:hypothetical protein SC1_03500 [Sphingopyxis sp. C-1]|nr:hypothetical protein SC1_03500 [Sphingopyxis sp. C-1]
MSGHAGLLPWSRPGPLQAVVIKTEGEGPSTKARIVATLCC